MRGAGQLVLPATEETAVAAVAVVAGGVVAAAGAGGTGLAVIAGGLGLAVGSVVARTWWVGVSVPAVVVVAMTAAAFVGLALRFGWSGTLPAETAFVAGLVALAGCDLNRLVLPKRIVMATGSVTAGWLLIVTGIGGRWARLGVAALCAVVAFSCLLVVNLVNPRWLGFGDVRLAGVMGFSLGWVGPACALAGFLLANVVGLLVALVLLGLGRTTRRTLLPFGVFLAVGAVGALLGTGALGG